MQNILLRELAASDIDKYLELQKEVYLVDVSYEEEIIRRTWELMFKANSVAYAIVTEDEKDFCGYCTVKNIEAGEPEIAIELLRKYHGRGIGFRALTKMMTDIGEREGISRFSAVVEPDNYISQRLMYKLGGVPGGIRTTIYLEEKEAEAFEKDHIGLLDSRLIQVANDFCVDSQKLLSHVLIFYISLTSLARAPYRRKLDDAKHAVCFIDNQDRKVSIAVREYAYQSITKEVLNILKKFGEGNFEEAKKEIISYLEKRQSNTE